MASAYITDEFGATHSLEKAHLLLPLHGNWTCYYIQASSNVQVRGKCTLTYFDRKMPAYVIQTGENQGKVSGVLCGGYGGLQQQLRYQFYDMVHAYRVPIDDMMRETGEILSPLSTQSVLLKSVPQWTRKAAEMGAQLNDICDYDGSVWRVLTDGSIFVGVDDWSLLPTFDFDLLEIAPAYVSCLLSVRALGVVPGKKFKPMDGLELRVGCVEYSLTPQQSSAKVWFLSDTATSLEDRLHSGLSSYIKEVMRGIDFLAQYPGEIIVQRLDKTVDFRPDSDKIPPMTSLKLNGFAPGVNLNITEKVRATMVFKGGNPAYPEIINFDIGAGGRPAARKDDKVDVGKLKFTVVGMGVLEGTYTAPNELIGVPFTLGTDIVLKGVISEGSDIVELS